MLAIAFHKPISATKARAILKVLNCLARKKFIFKHAGAGENHAWSSEPGIWQVVCKTMPAGHSVYENLRGIVSPDASSSIVSGNSFRKGVSKTTMTTAPRGDRW